MDKQKRKNYRLVLISIIGIMLFNFPLLSGISANTLFFGLPSLYAYIFICWFVLVFMIWMVLK